MPSDVVPVDPSEGQEPQMEGQPSPDAAPVPERAVPQQVVPEVPPMDPVIDDLGEMEARDELELELMLTAIALCKAVKVATEGASAKDCEQYASAAQHLVQAAVLLEPQEALDDADAAGEIPSVAAKSQLENTTTRGVRRTAGS